MLAPGTRFGPYKIVAPLGQGGMGEVYRAHDPRLDRDVAIKVLTSAVSADPERLRRFEHEARAAAALNHPNILTVHEIGQDATDPLVPPVPYVVSELLEGSTLREVLAAGALPLRKAIDYAVQIANGLAAAHAKGIVHRDLKPENLFVTRDGRVKILDFGLAKLTEGGAVASGAGASMLATRNFETAAGTVLGTMGYMSPEQLRGQTVDDRSDIFSFGAVLYEMLSGRRAFQGATAVDTITASLTSEPPELATTNASIPPVLEQVVRHCLEKTPELRYQAARDIVFALEALSVNTAPITAAMPAVAARHRLPRAGAYAAVAIAAAALVLLGGRQFGSRSSDWGAFRQLTFRHGVLGTARFTPDGHGIAYTAAWEGGKPEVYSLGVNESGGRSLGTENAELLAISPAGEMAILLAPKGLTPFLTTGALARGSTMGSAPRPEIDDVVAADYLKDGSLAIIREIPADRQCQLEYPVGTVLLRAAYLSDVRASPDGRYLATIEHKSAGDDRGAVVVLDLHGKTVATGPVVDSNRGLAWTPSGDEVWSSAPLLDGTIRALDLRGRSRNVLTVPGRLFLRDIAANGDVLVDQGSTRWGIIVASDGGRTERDLSWFDYSFLRGITDDGKQVFFDEEGSSVNGYRAFVRNVDSSPALEVGEGYALALSRDKAWMVTQKFTGAGTELWLYPVGPGQARRLSPPGWTLLARAAFFPDGKRIVYAAREATGPTHIYIQSIDGGAPKQIGGDGLGSPAISPDGRWIGATSPSGAVLIPTDGGAPVPAQGFRPGDSARGWTADGKVYVASAGTVRNGSTMRVDVVDPRTGQRSLWRELKAPAMDDVRITAPVVTPDGSTYAYGYVLSSSNLFLLRSAR